ncbi:MAG TPA: thymidine phosphorylase family protein [Aliidongia sp.]|nr:thymidine phosphorylase family protein [Aliidongia sp.]
METAAISHARADAPAAPTLKLRRVPVDTYREPVAYLPRRSSIYRPADFQALSKVEVKAGGRRLIAVLNVVDHDGWLMPDEVGVSALGFTLLGLPEGSAVEVTQAPPAKSLEAVRRKIEGEELSAADFRAIIGEITEMRYSKTEIAAFLIASASFLSTQEVLHLTEAMAGAGSRLDWPGETIVDKHCIGGVPGNRTSMIIVPIVAAHGLMIPKTSSRAITSPAGTADTMEVLAKVDLGIDEMRQVVRAEGGCLVWGGHVNLSPADDILISVERPLEIDTAEQMVASILSKKLAAGSNRLVIDIPLGPSAKVRSRAQAIRLKKLFEFVGDRLGLVLDVVITDGSQPIGRGIGPALEARDVMKVLAGEPDAPADLRDRALALAGAILDFDPALRGGTGRDRAQELLHSGAAFTKFERIVTAQGRAPAATQLGDLTHEAKAAHDGTVTAIDCLRIARIARMSGAPNDKGAGIDLLKKVGDRVEAGEPIYRIHAYLPADFRFAVAAATENDAFTLEPAS